MSEEHRESLLEQMRQLGAKHAQAKAQRIWIEEFKKSKLAILMKDAEVSGFKTVSAQEREAYANAEYQELIEGLKHAVEEEQACFWELQIIQYKFEKWRTLRADARAERRNYT